MGGSAYIRTIRSRIGHKLLLLPAVAIVVRDIERRVLHVQAQASSRWGLPAGGIEPGESPLSAARRELAEETGLRGIDLQLIGSCGGEAFRQEYANGDQVEYSIFLFGGSVAEASPLLPPDHEEVRAAAYFAREEAPVLPFPYPPKLVWGDARSCLA